MICSRLAKSRLVNLVALIGVVAASFATPKLARAIVINIEYTDEGDPTPHPENPVWDQDGRILKAHFQAAKTIWERLLPGDEEYTFDFHWDNDIGVNTLGLTTEAGIDQYMEINPNHNWFADPTPLDNSEFDFSGQQLIYNQLSAGDKAAYFTGTAPPGTLETRYTGVGSATALSDSNQSGVNANNGYDLLSTIVHEMGHVLGIGGGEPGDYNIYPHHVGGLENVLVLDVSAGGGHLGGNNISPGFLMCDSCGAPGRRRVPTATDVLVIAEDQGITSVNLARVDRISSGLWSDGSAWIGAVAPGIAQDAYIRHGGTVALNANAAAKSLLVGNANSLSVQNNVLTVDQALNYDTGAISVAAGGTIQADSINGNPAALTTTANTLVRFNSFTRGTSGAAVANFNGSVAIGYKPVTPGAPALFAVFDPSPGLSNWSVAEQLSIGDQGTTSTLAINGGSIFTSATGRIGTSFNGGGEGRVTIQDPTSSWTINGALDARNGSLNVFNFGVLTTGAAALGAADGQMIATVNNTTWTVNGNLEVRPSGIAGNGQPQLTIQNNGFVNVSGNLEVQGTSTRPSQVVVESNAALNVSGNVNVRAFGVVNYRDTTNSDTEDFHTESGGAVVFSNSARAESATFHNLGAPGFTGQGGRTELRDSAFAATATFNNHGSYAIGGRGKTMFLGSATAAAGTYNNFGGIGYLFEGGATEFYDSSTAGTGRYINHRGTLGFGGTTRFYGNSSGGSGTFRMQSSSGGTGRTEFHENSTAANGTFIIEAGGSGLGGGSMLFDDDSDAGSAQFTIEIDSYNAAIGFDENASAQNASFVLVDRSNSRIGFYGDSSAGQGNFDIGSIGSVQFLSRSSAADANITLRQNGNASFSGEYNLAGNPTVTAGTADIAVQGSSLAGGGVGRFGGFLSFSTWSSAGNATINTYGGTVAGAAGGTTWFDYSGRGGNATLITHGGVPGAAGGETRFVRDANGDSARAITHAGGLFSVAGNRFTRITTIGSIEGAGTYELSGAELETGSLNTDTTVSGPIIDIPSVSLGGKLTKVGAGTLTLAGTNTYTGLTTVNAGTLCLTGSIAGGAVINNGGMLKGSGTIGGMVTVNAGGVFEPGLTADEITLGGLNILPGGVFNFPQGEVVFAPNGGNASTSVLDVSIISGTSRLDLNNNDLVVRATAATKDAVHAAVQAEVKSAQNGLDAALVTKWDGPGVTSSAARTANVAAGFDLVGLGVIRNSDLDTTTGIPSSSYTSFSGQPVTPDDVLVKYTYIGDANLSGAVSFDDYVGMDNAFFGLIPNLGWATGDINFDGVINFDDYSKVDQAFFFQGAPLGGADAVAAVPEPGTALLACSLALLLIIGRRRRSFSRQDRR